MGDPGLPLTSPSRLPPGAGLIERIQAIAQNVSDIAVKVDQILHHSLKSAYDHCPLPPSPMQALALGRVEPWAGRTP
jgi:mannosyl alpha-1,6-glycoprotein beta-1,6-N-acetyl-glucosaminyltransferase isozyme B